MNIVFTCTYKSYAMYVHWYTPNMYLLGGQDSVYYCAGRPNTPDDMVLEFGQLLDDIGPMSNDYAGLSPIEFLQKVIPDVEVDESTIRMHV